MTDYTPPWGPSKKSAVPESLSTNGSFMLTPGYNMGQANSALKGLNIVLPCTPDLPSGYVGDPNGKSLSDGGTTTNNGSSSVKTASTSTFSESFYSILPNYDIEAYLSLQNLTGNEILNVSHRQNFYTDNRVLNSNIIDIIDYVNFFSPSQIITMQKPDVVQYKTNLVDYDYLIASSIVTVNIPSYKIEKSYKLEVEHFAPKYIKNDTIYT